MHVAINRQQDVTDIVRMTTQHKHVIRMSGLHTSTDLLWRITHPRDARAIRRRLNGLQREGGGYRRNGLIG